MKKTIDLQGVKYMAVDINKFDTKFLNTEIEFMLKNSLGLMIDSINQYNNSRIREKLSSMMRIWLKHSREQEENFFYVNFYTIPYLNKFILPRMINTLIKLERIIETKQLNSNLVYTHIELHELLELKEKFSKFSSILISYIEKLFMINYMDSFSNYINLYSYQYKRQIEKSIFFESLQFPFSKQEFSNLFQFMDVKQVNKFFNSLGLDGDFTILQSGDLWFSPSFLDIGSLPKLKKGFWSFMFWGHTIRYNLAIDWMYIGVEIQWYINKFVYVLNNIDSESFNIELFEQGIIYILLKIINIQQSMRLKKLLLFPLFHSYTKKIISKYIDFLDIITLKIKDLIVDIISGLWDSPNNTYNFEFKIRIIKLIRNIIKQKIFSDSLKNEFQLILNALSIKLLNEFGSYVAASIQDPVLDFDILRCNKIINSIRDVTDIQNYDYWFQLNAFLTSVMKLNNDSLSVDRFKRESHALKLIDFFSEIPKCSTQSYYYYKNFLLSIKKYNEINNVASWRNYIIRLIFIKLKWPNMNLELLIDDANDIDSTDIALCFPNYHPALEYSQAFEMPELNNYIISRIVLGSHIIAHQSKTICSINKISVIDFKYAFYNMQEQDFKLVFSQMVSLICKYMNKGDRNIDNLIYFIRNKHLLMKYVGGMILKCGKIDSASNSTNRATVKTLASIYFSNKKNIFQDPLNIVTNEIIALFEEKKIWTIDVADSTLIYGALSFRLKYQLIWLENIIFDNILFKENKNYYSLYLVEKFPNFLYQDGDEGKICDFIEYILLKVEQTDEDINFMDEHFNWFILLIKLLRGKISEKIATGFLEKVNTIYIEHKLKNYVKNTIELIEKDNIDAIESFPFTRLFEENNEIISNNILHGNMLWFESIFRSFMQNHFYSKNYSKLFEILYSKVISPVVKVTDLSLNIEACRIKYLYNNRVSIFSETFLDIHELKKITRSNDMILISQIFVFMFELKFLPKKIYTIANNKLSKTSLLDEGFQELYSKIRVISINNLNHNDPLRRYADCYIDSSNLGFNDFTKEDVSCLLDSVLSHLNEALHSNDYCTLAALVKRTKILIQVSINRKYRDLVPKFSILKDLIVYLTDNDFDFIDSDTSEQYLVNQINRSIEILYQDLNDFISSMKYKSTKRLNDSSNTIFKHDDREGTYNERFIISQ
jgi:hypothetical protein